MKLTLTGLSGTVSIGLLTAVMTSLFFSTIVNAEEQPGTIDASQRAATGAPPPGSPADLDTSWHTDMAMYLWFPGVHGTSGAGGHNVDFRASPGDLLSNFRFGLMGAVDAQRGRFVFLGDLMWVRLRSTNTKTSPFPGLPELSAEVKADQVLVTPEFGYRFLDGEKLKVDALAGIRYWHLGSNLQFTPSLAGLNFSGSRNWVDPVMGARIQVPLSLRVLATILGDAGGWGAGSELDYQIVGALGLKVSHKLTLSAGYRYLYVNYRPGSFVFDTAMSGAILGLTYKLK